MPYLFGLSYEVQRAVFDELQHVGHAVGTVQLYIALLLVDEGLVALGLKQFPCADEVLHHVDVRPCLDVEVAGIEIAADVQTGDELQRLVLRVGRGSLAVQVEVVALRCLQIALLERLTMPGAVALGYIHVVHVDGYPYIGRGIGNLVIDMLVDEEVVGACLAIFYAIDAWLLHLREVELHVVVFEVRSPRLDVALEGHFARSVFQDAQQ